MSNVTLYRIDKTKVGSGASLREIAEEHSADLSLANLFRADLSGANLSGADLSGANLFHANLSRADLSGANLSLANLSLADLSSANLSLADLSLADLSRADLSLANLSLANLSGATKIDTGETWERYLAEVVPAFLESGGKSIEEIVASGAWECHDWNNCPTAVAFGVSSIKEVSILLQPRAEQFIRYFDAGLITRPGGAS